MFGVIGALFCVMVLLLLFWVVVMCWVSSSMMFFDLRVVWVLLIGYIGFMQWGVGEFGLFAGIRVVEVTMYMQGLVAG